MRQRRHTETSKYYTKFKKKPTRVVIVVRAVDSEVSSCSVAGGEAWET